MEESRVATRDPHIMDRWLGLGAPREDEWGLWNFPAALLLVQDCLEVLESQYYFQNSGVTDCREIIK